jgi:hypothetical protein
MSTLANAEELMRFVAVTLHELVMPANLRIRVATACLGVALDHHQAITILVANDRMASAFALARPVFESFLRGAWLTHCATANQVKSFSTGWSPPKIYKLLEDIENKPGYDGKVLSSIKASSWRSMCEYTHTGGRQIQRWQTESSVEPKYSMDEVEEVLLFTNLFACLSAIELVGISGNEEKFESLTRSLAKYLPAEA